MPQVTSGVQQLQVWISGPTEIALFAILLTFAALAVIITRSLVVFGIAVLVCGLAAAGPGIANTVYTYFGGGGAVST